MDREYPTSRAELESKERWPYNDLQSLASDLDYGNPVGAARADLVAHAVDELDLPTKAPDREIDRDEPAVGEEGESDSRQTAAEESVDTSPSTDTDREGTDRDAAATTDGGTQTAPKADAIDVGHQGSEKLSPENAPDSDGTPVEPPGDLESGDIDHDVLDRDTSDSSPEEASRQDETEDRADSDTREDTSEGNDSGEESKGGLRDRLGLGSSDESPDDVVEEAEDPAERERRREMKEKFESAMGDGADQDAVEEAVNDADSGETAPTTAPAAGMMMDEEIVGHLIEMPFNTASAATGWEGWELSSQERKANARLFVAMCDEHDVDVTPTTMFALSMASTFGGKAVRYRRQKDDEEDADRTSTEFEDDVEEVNGRDGRKARTDRAGATSPNGTESQSETPAERDWGF